MKYTIASVKTVIECVTYTIYFICSMFVDLYCKLEYKFVTFKIKLDNEQLTMD